MLALSLLAVAPAAAPAEAASPPKTWPQGCVTDVASDDKQSYKLFSDWFYEGYIEVECGSVWDTNADGSPNQNSPADSRFTDTSGHGAIEGFNDYASSVLVINRSTFGVCFVFYGMQNYTYGGTPIDQAGVFSIWVDGKPAGSKHRWASIGRLHTDVFNQGPGRSTSSGRAGNDDARPFMGIDDESSCRFYWGGSYWSNYDNLDEGVVW